MAQFNAPIMDQGQTGSCTGHGTAQAVYTAWGSLGIPRPFVPSPAGVYTPTRCLDRAAATPAGTPLPALTDAGGMPADVMLALAKYGVRPIQAPTLDGRYSDVDGTNLTYEPNLADLELSGQKIVTGEYRIDETASDFIALIQAAIAGAKIPCGIAVLVGSKFMNWNPASGPISSPDDPSSPDSGGHWLSLDAYDTYSGGVVFSGPNSWSEGFGQSGRYAVTGDWLRQSCSDCYPFHLSVTP
jgi:hypothetical protein